MNAKVLQIKIGLPTLLTFDDGTQFESAIRKQPVDKVFITTLGPQGNDVGLKAHHGGVDKAVFFMAADTFEKLNRLTGAQFDYQGTAIYGENLVLSALNEENVRIGDVYQIGDCLIEICQPRRPCSRLSKNTHNENMKETIFVHGLTGWYGRVLQEGQIHRGDAVILKRQGHPELTVMSLNQLLIDNSLSKISLIHTALAYAPLAAGFKRSLEGKLRGEDGRVKG
ncbi:MOSC domain-containing protein YiiM [Cricetibacter osteomyelitidis]|uniref:MOSC domain-containing protein YiiM n=2 Tax=Cricetibacter osteomyelitidis TaxID=1521931 RepID=A0A4R2SWC7_9PAST|nr:MOSC domain-containing protein YiiM [Cricetibacter osteomyelitidis]